MPLVLRIEDFNIDYILQQSHNKSFEDYKLKKIPSRKYEVIKIAKDRSSIKLIDKNQLDLLSVVNGAITSYHNKEYFEISGTYSKNKGNGDMTYLFKFIVYELGLSILSDREHTSLGSKEFWQAQIRRKNFNIYRINIKTNYKRKARGYKESDIWTLYKTDASNLFSGNLYEDYILNESDIENSSSLDFELDELDEETKDELELELGIITNKEKLNMGDIRLIAQNIH